ncbi:aspartyl protease [Brucella neotomae]|nr:hypothetical protein DK64_2097 [Brucella neotomae 5K33]SPU66176.1 aspartyl protease [Brucella neotomae]SPU66510.1 aspartyl protease [Brucella neotomae]SUW39623.1 aspartyl protease [Brucella neotomae]
MGRFFWLVIAAVALVVLLLMSNNDSGTTLGVANDAFARAAYFRQREGRSNFPAHMPRLSRRASASSRW